MFYRPGPERALPEGLERDPFKAIVAPRPIGWISTVDASGRANLAPYSFFNGCCDSPPMVMFSTTGRKIGASTEDALTGAIKDTIANIRETGEFAVNVVSDSLRDAMNASSGHYAPDVDEFERAGLEKAACEAISAPRVAAAPATLECRLFQMVELPGWTPESGAVMAIGEVVGVHVDDAHVVDGRLDVTSYAPLARLGYLDYAAVREVFSLRRPGQKG